MSDLYVSRQEYDDLKEQFELALQMLYRTHLTLLQISKGGEVRVKLKPGLEDIETPIDHDVPDDAPKIRLVPKHMPVSGILGSNGKQFVGK